MPAGSWRRMVCDIAVTCALAVSRRAFGCKKIFTIAWPFTVVDSMCSMLSTVVVRTRSYWVVIRPSISSGFRPVNCQATAMTGMSTLGKISVGVRRMTTGLRMRIKSARTMNVYGRLRATLTIHIVWPAHLSPDVRPRVSHFPITLLKMPKAAAKFRTQLTASCRSWAPAAHMRRQEHHEKLLQIKKADPLGRLRVTGRSATRRDFVFLRKPSVTTAGTKRNRFRAEPWTRPIGAYKATAGRFPFRRNAKGRPRIVAANVHPLATLGSPNDEERALARGMRFRGEARTGSRSPWRLLMRGR